MQLQFAILSDAAGTANLNVGKRGNEDLHAHFRLITCECLIQRELAVNQPAWHPTDTETAILGVAS